MFIEINNDVRPAMIIKQHLDISEIRKFAVAKLDQDDIKHQMKIAIGERGAESTARLSLWPPHSTTFYFKKIAEAKEQAERIYTNLLNNNIFTLKINDYFPDNEFSPTTFYIVAKYIINLGVLFDGEKYTISCYTDYTHPLGLTFPTKELLEENLDKFYSALNIKKAPELEIIKC